MKLYEMNFDGIVGPTHHFGGLSHGNKASTKSEGEVSQPKKAALQGLSKAYHLMKKGFLQAVLPPQRRPCFSMLSRLGYVPSYQGLENCQSHLPVLISPLYSSSFMWAANSATMIPSIDSLSDRPQFFIANLTSNFHRSLEDEERLFVFRQIFSRFVVHASLPHHTFFGDEGAANHTRLGNDEAGLHLFVYGQADDSTIKPTKYPARQTREASQLVSRLMMCQNPFYLQQNPDVIDQGVFHNDVISVGSYDHLFFHEEAYADPHWRESLLQSYESVTGESLTLVEVSSGELTVAQAVTSYLFNSQLIRQKDGDFVLVVPKESQTVSEAWDVIQRVLKDKNNRINHIEVFDLKQSMKNGGGPACLRLRAQFTEEEISQVHQGVVLSESLYQQLSELISNEYPDEFVSADFLNENKIKQAFSTYENIMHLLKLNPLGAGFC